MTSVPINNNTHLETTSDGNNSNNFAKDICTNTSDSLKLGRQEMYRSHQASAYEHFKVPHRSRRLNINSFMGRTRKSPDRNEHFYRSSWQQSPTTPSYRRNMQIDDLKYSMDRSLHLIRREMDTRLERLEEDVSRSQVESNKLRGIAFSREEDHARSCLRYNN